MQRDIDWLSVFTERFPSTGATDAELSATLAALTAPLSQEEILSITQSQTNPFPPSDPLYHSYRPFNPAAWTIPNRPLPSPYINFLHWSNGGSFFNHDRHFDPFLSCSELRQYLIAYHFPQYLPGAVSFALDGNGNAYFFDMRQEPTAGEYPILLANLGSLRYEQAVTVGSSFIEVCAGVTDPLA